MSGKLLGRYKGTRKRAPAPAPAIIIIECPGCGWRSQPAKAEKAEVEYVLHMENNHHGSLQCAFCPTGTGRGISFLPSFETLASHVHHFHGSEKLPDGRTIADIDPMALPPHAFNFASKSQNGEENMALARPVNTVGNVPAGKTTNWLRDSDVSTTPQTVTIVDARPDESGRAAVVIKLKLSTGVRLDSLKANNPNFKILFDAFGEDEKSWKGKKVNLFLEYDSFSERNWRRYSIDGRRS